MIRHADFHRGESRRKELGEIYRAVTKECDLPKDILLFSKAELDRWKTATNHVTANALRKDVFCMAGSDTEHARALLEMAKKEHRALSRMLDSQDFAEEVFGFHAQQAVEKALKAWIAAKALVYPRSHDLSALAKILGASG